MVISLEKKNITIFNVPDSQNEINEEDEVKNIFSNIGVSFEGFELIRLGKIGPYSRSLKMSFASKFDIRLTLKLI